MDERRLMVTNCGFCFAAIFGSFGPIFGMLGAILMDEKNEEWREKTENEWRCCS